MLHFQRLRLWTETIRGLEKEIADAQTRLAYARLEAREEVDALLALGATREEIAYES